MSKDPLLYILIAILALHVFLPNFITLNIITYVFIIYMLIVFVQSLKKKEY